MDVAAYLAGLGSDLVLPSEREANVALDRWFGPAYLAGATSASSGRSTRYSVNISTSPNQYLSPTLSAPNKKRQKHPKKSAADLVAERRLVHRQLVKHLEAMSEGVCGVGGQVFADKWLDRVKLCPGVTRRHKPCGKLAFEPYSCHFLLCPHCAARRAITWRRSLEGLIEQVGMAEPKLLTLTMPALLDLDRAAVRAVIKAFAHFLRLKSLASVVGGVRTVEVTFNPKKHTWNLHIHALIDAPYLQQYPSTDLRWDRVQWEGGAVSWLRSNLLDLEYAFGVRKTPDSDFERWGPISWKSQDLILVDALRPKQGEAHMGLARAWTMATQAQPRLRRDLNIDDANTWNYIDIRRADSGSIAEVTKYITKQSELLAAGPDRILEFAEAFKGARLVQGFGTLHGVKVDVATGHVDGLDGEFGADLGLGPVEPPQAGECPHRDCPAPGKMEWEFVCRGLPDTLQIAKEWDALTGQYRITVSVPDG